MRLCSHDLRQKHKREGGGGEQRVSESQTCGLRSAEIRAQLQTSILQQAEVIQIILAQHEHASLHNTRTMGGRTHGPCLGSLSKTFLLAKTLRSGRVHRA